MTMRTFDRRAFLLGTVALGGGVAGLAVMRPASALTLEKIPSASPLGVAFSNRCQPNAEHDRIRAMLEQQLAGQTGTPGTYISQQAYCPICGCPITVSRYIPN